MFNNRSKTPTNFKRKQTGTVLITVVLIAAVVVVMVVESVKTVRYQKQLSSNLINRDQAFSYLMGMEELAKIWLKKAFENEKEETVHLNQPWAQDDITFPLDGGGMIASITDMQSCFNLNSINAADDNTSGRGGNNSNSGRSDDDEDKDDDRNRAPTNGFAGETTGQLILEELIGQASRDGNATGKALAAATRDWIDEDIDAAGPDGAEDDYYQSLEVPYRTANSLIAHSSELLAVRGFNYKSYQQIKPYVCVLPDQNVSAINVNTVTAENAQLVYAVLGGKVPLADVTSALAARGEKGFETPEEFFQELGSNADVKAANKARIIVTSSYFQMSAKAEIGKTRVSMKTLFKRNEDNSFKVISRYFGKE